MSHGRRFVALERQVASRARSSGLVELASLLEKEAQDLEQQLELKKNTKNKKTSAEIVYEQILDLSFENDGLREWSRFRIVFCKELGYLPEEFDRSFPSARKDFENALHEAVALDRSGPAGRER